MEIPDDQRLPDTISKYALAGIEREREYFAILRERHEKIKQERRGILTTLIGLSGGAIVLSASLLGEIATLRIVLWLLVLSWSLLGMSIITALLGLAAMTRHSIRYQRLLEQRLVDPLESSDRVRLGGGDERSRYFYSPSIRRSRRNGNEIFMELAAGVLFVSGAILLGIFAMLNLAQS